MKFVRHEDTERFWSRVRFAPDEGACWLWSGRCNPSGHGIFEVYSDGKRVGASAHRVMHRLLIGTPPDGMEVCHRCDNASCVNPAHLFLGTHAQNMRDMAMKGRASRGANHKHSKLSPVAVALIKRDLLNGVSQGRLARQHGVYETAIHKIAKGVNWRHVAPATGGGVVPRSAYRPEPDGGVP